MSRASACSNLVVVLFVDFTVGELFDDEQEALCRLVPRGQVHGRVTFVVLEKGVGVAADQQLQTVVVALWGWARSWGGVGGVREVWAELERCGRS